MSVDKRETTAACPRCGKAKNANPASGDLAEYLLQSNYCTCDQIKTAVGPLKPLSKVEDDESICPKCGLQLATSLPGSMTGFLFQDIRCKCKADAALSPGSMSSKFFNLKAQDGGRTFYAGQSAGSAGALTINLAAGAIIGGIYRIKKLIGSGGMGEVYEAEHTGLGKVCALKVVPPEKVTEVGWLRFQQEAKTVAALNHLNLVHVSDLGIHEGCLPFYAMELVEGKNLAEMLAAHGAIPCQTAIEIFKQVCDGVDHAHRAGIVHRDLKPGNIMVAKQGKHWHVKILDFGLAKLTKHTREKQGLTSVGEIFGSPFYMSPEQCSGGKQDNRSDIYSLGCTLFECLTGKPPFAGNNATEIIAGHEHYDAPSVQTVAGIMGNTSKFPPGLEIIMAKLLRKNPVERYQTCAELKADLERLERGETIQPYYVSRTQAVEKGIAEIEATDSPLVKRAAMRPLLVAGLVMGLIATAGGGYGLYLSNERATKVSAKAAQKNAPSELVEALSFHDINLSKKEQAALVPDAPKTVPQSAEETEPYSKLVKINGKLFRSYNFPEDVAIGSIKAGLDAKEVPARGKVILPLNDYTVFCPFPAITLSANYFKRFQQDDFNDLMLRDASDFNRIVSVLPNFADYKKVKYISLSVNSVSDSLIDKEPVKLNENSIAILSKLERPLDFYCPANLIDAKQLLELPWINKLQVVELQRYPNLDALIHQMRGNDALQKITMNDSDMTLSGWTDIATFKSLSAIDGGVGANNLLKLKAIAAMPKLTMLYAGNLGLTEGAFRILRQMKSLKMVRLHNRDQYDDLTLARARTALPGVVFTFVRGGGRNLRDLF